MATTRRILRAILVGLLMLVMFAAGWVAAKTGTGSLVDRMSLSDRERQFADRMKDVALVGRFTITGREEREVRPDRYEIASVENVGGDQWRFNTRVMYGKVDVTLPIVVTIQWAGDTPMVTITDYTIPTLGTFTARVFFYGDRYAGTWQHGQTGGHLFGRIEKRGRS